MLKSKPKYVVGLQPSKKTGLKRAKAQLHTRPKYIPATIKHISNPWVQQMFGKIWRWLKKWWQQLLGKSPQPSPPAKRKHLSDAEFESLFLQLLDRVEEGASWGNIKGFLISRRIDEDELVAWLRRFGSKLLESPETHRELGRRMVQLGKVAGGELGDVAGEIGRELLGNSETRFLGETGFINTFVNSNVDNQTVDRTNSVSVDVPVGVDGEAIEWYSRGTDEYIAGNIQAALGCFQRAIEISPNFDDAWNGLGVTLKDLGQYQKAIEAYQKAIKISPNFHHAWNGLGNVLSDLGQYQKAIEAFQKAIEISPNFHYAWNGLGNALRDLGQYQKAIEAFNRALEITHNQLWQTWANRGGAIYYLHGYQAALQNWDEGLQSLQPETPEYQEGCTVLHQYKGDAHYDYGKQQPNPHPYWRESRNSYITALKTLSGSKTSILGEVLVAQVSPRFQLIYLEILQKLAKVCNALNYQDDFQLCLDIGDTMLENLLLETDSQQSKIQLANKFATFSQLRVVLLAQSSQPKEALLLAEKRKNLCLRWLRESRYVGMREETPLQYPEIEQFLSPGMAAIYWHYSPAAITIFIIKHDGIEIHSPENTAVKQLEKFEDWLKVWKEEYQLNRKDAKGAKEEKESWRDQMVGRLDELGKILDVEGILNKIGDDITELILIPHRDLHLLPLHYLWREKGLTISYLPSLKVGIDLATNKLALHPAAKLLNVESPSHLLFAETESQLINLIYENSTYIKINEVTKNRVIAALENSAHIFHFTGHGKHNLQQPLESALELANKEMLTLQDILKLNLQSYQLACLSACETGITSKQGIIDEYVGLVSGFLATGVNYVVSTLWQVGEIETALMMIKFHQLYKDGIPPKLACQESQIWLRTRSYADLIQWYNEEAAKVKKYSLGCAESLGGAASKVKKEAQIKGMDYCPYSHPFYWAGFIIAGNG